MKKSFDCQHCQMVFPTMLDLLCHTKSQHSNEKHSLVLAKVKKKFEESKKSLETKSDKITDPLDKSVKDPLDKSDKIANLRNTLLVPANFSTCDIFYQ